MNNKQPQQRININLEELETLACPNCKSTVFQTSLVNFKKLPAIQSPTGQTQLIAINLAKCCNCDAFFRVEKEGLIPIYFNVPEEEET